MPILDSNTFEFISRSPDQTRRIGIRLGAFLQPQDLVCLSGDLGAGKTTLVQGIARGWGSIDNVTSPTFVLVNNYRRADGSELNHLDAYRLSGASEAEDLDIPSLINESPLLVEWPERIREALPSTYLWIQMTWLADEQRGMLFRSSGDRYEFLLEQIKESMIKSLI